MISRNLETKQKLLLISNSLLAVALVISCFRHELTTARRAICRCSSRACVNTLEIFSASSASSSVFMLHSACSTHPSQSYRCCRRTTTTTNNNNWYFEFVFNLQISLALQQLRPEMESGQDFSPMTRPDCWVFRNNRSLNDVKSRKLTTSQGQSACK